MCLSDTLLLLLCNQYKLVWDLSDKSPDTLLIPDFEKYLLIRLLKSFITNLHVNYELFFFQKLEYFTKILRLIMSLHRDIMELQLQCAQDIIPPRPEHSPFRVPPKIKAEISMKWQEDKLRYIVTVDVPENGNCMGEGVLQCAELKL